ncbi:MAG TPA: JAB domain-containing protein [Mucilaginibacter sp.]|nr:JAB domain-containing protein [Mucilaginibacter sp.]
MNDLNVNPLYQVAEVELIYRNETLPENRIKVFSSDTAYQVLKQAWDRNKIELVEQFKILLLDYRSNCLGISNISTGGMNLCPIDIRIVFATALKAKASRIIAAHNHPSGNLDPSKEDIYMTNKLVQAGKTIGIEVVEHMIVTPYSFYSFADNGLIP